MLQKGDTVKCVVLEVDQQKQRVALGLKQLHEDPWLEAIPSHYQPGMIVKGKVTKITNFGVFVELEPELEGLLHVSELADHKVDDPHDEVHVGDEIEVKILRVDSQERKIGLSKKRAEWATEDASGDPSKPRARRGGLHGPGEESTDMIQNFPLKQPRPAGATDAAEEPDAAEEAEAPAEPTADEES
jgi:small subunit ribosomal protein S1